MRRIRTTKTKFTVIIGYILVMGVMALGLIALYNNLVDYSNKKINNQDLSELLTVSNTLSLLYEIESEQNLMTAESAELYFQKYDSIVPVINANMNELKEATMDSSRVMKLDSITLLVEMKKENLLEMAVLLDSLRRAPQIIQQTESSYVPRELNREIANYLESKDLNAPAQNRSDTSVVMGERRRFMDRVRDVFDGRADSTIVIESRSVVADNEFRLIVDTLINKVRYSERLDLDRQRKFQAAFLERQGLISQTNRMLTGRIDDLLKEIEQEEMAKSVQLLIDKEEALARSEDTMHLASLAAVVIALIFGLLFLIDINKSQRYRKQLEASNRRVSDLLQSRERLMLTISHDIKAPMSSIMGYIELMDAKADATRKDKEYLANMQKSSQHVLQLVSTLLDYHKLETGIWQMRESNVQLKSLVDETILSFKPMAISKGLEWHVDNSLPDDTVCYADPYVLRQVMSNLISNAIKHTPEGKVVITAREEARDDASHFVFRVADTGPGIEKENQQVIFQDFRQLDGASGPSERVEGSGLGLAITQRFVNELKGEISLESEKNVGSEFTISLPIVPEKEVELLEKDRVDTGKSDRFNDERSLRDFSVLVVDDDLVQLKMVEEMLALAGVNGVTINSPEQVLPRLKEQRFDLLFLDLQMPNMDGLTLVQDIRASGIERVGDLPIIALSARPDVTEEELKEVGFSGFLTKPFTFQQFKNAIRRFAPNGKKELHSRELHEGNSNGGKELGVSALIDFVKEDKAASLGILQSFEDEASRYIVLLKEAFNNRDKENAKRVAHTVLPLVRMMKGAPAVSSLESLEGEVMLSTEKEVELLNWLEDQVKAAKELIREIENDREE